MVCAPTNIKFNNSFSNFENEVCVRTDELLFRDGLRHCHSRTAFDKCLKSALLRTRFKSVVFSYT